MSISDTIMKLVLVAQNYHPFVGGVETHARQLVQDLHRRGHEVCVVAVNFSPCLLPRRLALLHNNLLAPRHTTHTDGDVTIHALTPNAADRIRMLPIAVRVLPGAGRLAGYARLEWFGYRSYRRAFLPHLRRLVKGADVVHSLAGNYLGWAAQLATQEFGIPFVCTPFVHPRQWGDGPQDVAYYQRADAVIGLLESDARNLVAIGVPEQRVHVVGVSPDLPAGTDPSAFRRKHQLGTAPLVLYVGRMMPQKGAQAVLRAAPLTWNHFPEARFVFIGPQTRESTGWFRGLDRRVLCLGRVSPQEKADALAACDVFCMPSLSEILPTVYLEAWSLGKPVIGGLAHGLPELVEANGAGLVTAQDPPAVAEAIGRLMADPDLRRRMGATGRQMVEARYSVQAVSGRLLDIYSKLVARKQEGAGL